MDFSLKPHPLVAHWVPGLVVLLAVLFSVYNWDYTRLAEILAPDTPSVTLSVLILAVTAFVLGEILDSLRDILEWRPLGGWPLKKWLPELFSDQWETFFIKAKAGELRKFEEYYFTYYVLDFNMALGLVVAVILTNQCIKYFTFSFEYAIFRG